jgi:hypothetical protein
VIHLALSGAAKQMTRAAELLERQRTGSQTQTAQEAARQRFAQLLAAMENRAKAGKEGQESGGSGGGKGGGRQDGNQALTQLKLLKILQEDLINRYRTATVDDHKDNVEQQLAEIAAEQEQLADLALKLSQPTAENPEDDPEQLPDVRDSNQGPDPVQPDVLPADAIRPKNPVPPPDDLLDPNVPERSP